MEPKSHRSQLAHFCKPGSFRLTTDPLVEAMQVKKNQLVPRVRVHTGPQGPWLPNTLKHISYGLEKPTKEENWSKRRMDKEWSRLRTDLITLTDPIQPARALQYAQKRPKLDECFGSRRDSIVGCSNALAASTACRVTDRWFTPHVSVLASFLHWPLDC